MLDLQSHTSVHSKPVITLRVKTYSFTRYNKSRIFQGKKRDRRQEEEEPVEEPQTPPCFTKIAACALEKNHVCWPKMLSLLLAPKHDFTPLSTVEKGTCKRRISATFLGMLTIFIRAVPKIFCRVNRP